MNMSRIFVIALLVLGAAQAAGDAGGGDIAPLGPNHDHGRADAGEEIVQALSLGLRSRRDAGQDHRRREDRHEGLLHTIPPQDMRPDSKGPGGRQ